MQGASYLFPPVYSPVTLWDLSLVRSTLYKPPFELHKDLPLLLSQVCFFCSRRFFECLDMVRTFQVCLSARIYNFRMNPGRASVFLLHQTTCSGLWSQRLVPPIPVRTRFTRSVSASWAFWHHGLCYQGDLLFACSLSSIWWTFLPYLMLASDLSGFLSFWWLFWYPSFSMEMTGNWRKSPRWDHRPR